MGQTAENIVSKFNVSREDQDAFALASQQKAEAALKSNRFASEIMPIEVKSGKDEIQRFEKDEYPRSTSLEKLSQLRPAFNKTGSVTAGNSSGLNDGAAILILASSDACKRLQLKPLAKIVAAASAGVDPTIMGTGPIPASRKCLEKAGWTVNDLDLVEANEAFAAQALCVNRELKLDSNKVNVNGGAIALGHPIGASGARILVSLLHEMQRREVKKGLATLCIGGGQGMALAIECM